MAAAYLHRQGGRRSRSLQALATEILLWAEKHLLSLSAIHLKGTLNRVADFLSRQSIQGSRVVSVSGGLRNDFHYVGTARGAEVDLVASEKAQIPQFFSLNNLEGSLGIDALAHPWRFHLCYACPPFQLIPLVLRKIQQERVSVILITQFWPKRALFSTVLGMATKPCWHLPLRQDLLIQGPVNHPEVASLSLAAWYLRSSS